MLGNDSSTFLNEIAYINFKRLKFFGLISILIFSALFFLDFFYFFSGKFITSIGYTVLLYAHLTVLLLLTTFIILTWIKPVNHSNDTKIFHKWLVEITLLLSLFNIVAISIGDVLINGSIAAYLGTIFAFASIFLITNTFCSLLFLSGMAFMNISLIIISIKTGQFLTIQIINSTTFSILSMVLSRVIFYYQLREFKTKMTVEEKSKEIQKINRELQSSLENIKILSGLLPICSYCKKIRDDKGYWNELDAYIQKNSEAEFSHGICQECAKKHFPDLDLYP